MRFDYQKSGQVPREVQTPFRLLASVLDGLRRDESSTIDRSFLVDFGLLVAKTARVTRTDAGTVSGTDTLSFTTNWVKVQLTDDWTAAFDTVQAGGIYLLEIQQAAAGSKSVTFPAGLAWGTTGAPTITATADKTDLILMAATSTSAYYGFTILQNA